MFKLNRQEAIAYDQRGGFINQAGKYKTIIESAVWHIGQNNNGRSENIRLTVTTEQKQKATFFINTSYASGTTNEGGIRLINAILACLKMRETGEPVPATVKEYNPDTRQEEPTTRDCFTTLHGKRLGIVVQMVHEDGRENPSPTIFSVFESDTELTASEVLRQETQPQQLGKVMEYIANKPLVDKRKQQAPAPTPVQPPQRQAPVKAVAPQEDIDDDIPF